MILITDGEYEGNANEAPSKPDAGIMVNAIGIGSVEGTPVPDLNTVIIIN